MRITQYEKILENISKDLQQHMEDGSHSNSSSSPESYIPEAETSYAGTDFIAHRNK